MEKNFYAITLLYQLHIHTNICAKYLLKKILHIKLHKAKKQFYRFRFFFILQFKIIITKNKLIEIRKNHPNINHYNAYIIINLRYNHNIFFILTYKKI